MSSHAVEVQASSTRDAHVMLEVPSRFQPIVTMVTAHTSLSDETPSSVFNTRRGKQRLVLNHRSNMTKNLGKIWYRLEP